MQVDKKTINRLKRAEGQLRGIQAMIDKGDDCVDVITQLRAVRSSIDRLIGVIVADNLHECLKHPNSDPAIQEEKIEQALNLIITK